MPCRLSPLPQLERVGQEAVRDRDERNQREIEDRHDQEEHESAEHLGKPQPTMPDNERDYLQPGTGLLNGLPSLHRAWVRLCDRDQPLRA